MFHGLAFTMTLNRNIHVVCFAFLLLLVQSSTLAVSGMYCPAGCECPSATVVECSGISSFPNLTEPNNFTDFVFSGCRFENGIMPDLPERFGNASSLVIQNCTGKVYETTFDSLKQLKNLTISGNYRLDVASSTPFSSLKSLGRLDLSSNELTKLPDNLCEGTPNLWFLNASNNRLNTVPVHAFEVCWNHLENAYLQQNDFTALNYDSLPWSSLLDFNLSQNPWNCGCEMNWVKYMERSRFENVSCASPENVKGKGLYDVEVALSCGEILPIALGIGIPILIVGLIITGYFVYKYCRNHRTKRRLRSSVKYSSVYGETVESNSKHFMLE